MKIGIVVPHIFMQQDILPHVIFAPAKLALELAEGVAAQGHDVTLFSPGPVKTPVRNITADLQYFEQELAGRGDTYIDLLKKHPLTFISLARQVQAELIAQAFAMANNGGLDIVHIYTNEEDIALPFAALCTRPVVFTHHDPFNFLVKYKNVFPKYRHLSWISMSLAQRRGMPADTNWAANIYHGLPAEAFEPNYAPQGDYFAYLGRIIEPKGVHLAVAAVRSYNQAHGTAFKLKIAGKHYAGTKDTYWRQRIKPALGPDITYEGFISRDADKQAFLGNARALIVPSIFEEPFGMVTIESLACGTPVVGIASGAIPEIVEDARTGYVVMKQAEETRTVHELAAALDRIGGIDRHTCRQQFEARFTTARMCAEHTAAYARLCEA